MIFRAVLFFNAGILMSKLMRSVSGIRGIVGDTLTPTTLLSHVKAFLEITKAKKIVIGRDSRPTGEAISNFVTAFCRLAGTEVIDVGLSTTPSVEILVTHTKADGGIIITASHNPVEWNALKFLNNQGLFLGPKDVEALFKIADQGNFSFPDYTQVATSSLLKDADDVHINATLGIEFVDTLAIKNKHFKVAIDAVNGAGSFIMPRLLEALGCEVFRVHCTPNGHFPRGAEPLPENLKDLSKAVLEHQCDVGFALDPDADRCALVDGHGSPIGEEYTLAIAMEEVLSQKKGPVCVNLSTSRMNEDIAKKYNCLCSRSKVGEINVSLQMIETKCIIGGEGNGGVILPALHYGRDSLVAAALVLSWMAHHNNGPQKFVQENQQYFMPKKKFNLTDKPLSSILEEVKIEFNNWEMDSRDGLRFAKDKSWVHVRASNTEPVLRVIAEATTEEEAIDLCKRVEKHI